MRLQNRIADFLTHAVRMTDFQPFALAPCPALLIAGEHDAAISQNASRSAAVENGSATHARTGNTKGYTQ